MTETNPEDIFPPKPGGMVDTVRRQKQAEADQLAGLDAAVVTDSARRPAVRVREDEPDLGTTRTVTLSSANPYAQLLPRDTCRRGAIVLAVDNDVYLSYNEGSAQDAGGSTSSAGGVFYLPAGIAIPVDSQAQLWASPTTTATASRVSVLISRDST